MILPRKTMTMHLDSTEEELDYIINCDIKYRMNKDRQEHFWKSVSCSTNCCHLIMRLN